MNRHRNYFAKIEKEIANNDEFSSFLCGSTSNNQANPKIESFIAFNSKPEFYANSRVVNENRGPSIPSIWDMENKTYFIDRFANPFWRIRFLQGNLHLSLFKELKAKLTGMGLRFDRRKKGKDDCISNLLYDVFKSTIQKHGDIEAGGLRECLLQVSSNQFANLEIEEHSLDWLRVTEIFRQIFTVLYDRIMESQLSTDEQEDLNFLRLPGAFDNLESREEDEAGLALFPWEMGAEKIRDEEEEAKLREDLDDDWSEDEEDEELFQYDAMRMLRFVVNKDKFGLNENINNRSLSFEYSVSHLDKMMHKARRREKSSILADLDFDEISDSDPVTFRRRREKLRKQKTKALMDADELRRVQEQLKNEQLEQLRPQKQEKQTKLKEFEQRFGAQLRNALSSYVSAVGVCLDLLLDSFKTNDEIGERIILELGQNFEAAFFLMENRQVIFTEFAEVQAEVARLGLREKKIEFVAVQGNFTFTKKSKKKRGRRGNKQKSKKEKVSNVEVEFALGLTKETKMDDGLQNLKEDVYEKFGLFRSDPEEIDFVGISDEKIYDQYGVIRKEQNQFLLYDVQPKERNEDFLKTDRLKIQEILPKYQWKAFTDSDSLNALQSKIFDGIFNTDENVLCCAPTGAGKTNVALLSVLRLVKKNYSELTRRLTGDFKVVYISPLKALATEVVRKFSKKLGYLGVKVREYTGDVSLSKQDILSTHIIVTTPEKWDVVTRKSESLNSMVSLLIIDEIHLLDDERGRVLECLVARTSRLIISKQCRIRILGLSATLPNYKDVARFINVGPKGLYHFDESYRPVPLRKKFIAVKPPQLFTNQRSKMRMTKDKQFKETKTSRKNQSRLDVMNQVAYDHLRSNLRLGHQVLVFVHSRKETFKLGQFFYETAMANGEMNLFITESHRRLRADRAFENQDLRKLASRGIGSHNAGLKRKDRLSVEKAFIGGQLSVVVCTATLAWGINMPCHTVIIKGTDYYDPGFGFKPISLLDVQQIFGRAGRPQFDTEGEAVLITKLEDINYFVSMLSYVKPIESKFPPFINEAMLAEIVLGNITNMSEAVEFIRCTFYFVRMGKNPTFYGVKGQDHIEIQIINKVRETLLKLHRMRVIRFDEPNDVIEATELGRITSHYYINCDTMEMICHYLRMHRDDTDGSIEEIQPKNLLGIIAQSAEFDQISSKAQEEPDLVKLKKKYKSTDVDKDYKELHKKKDNQSNPTQDGSIDKIEKTLLLFWGYLHLESYDNYSLIADTNYITQNGTRVLRCLLEVAIKQNAAYLVETILEWVRFIENCVNEFNTPLRMFCLDNHLRSVSYYKNQASHVRRSEYLGNRTCALIEGALENLVENGNEIYAMREDPSIIRDLRLPRREGEVLSRVVEYYPIIDFDYEVKPIAQTIMKVYMRIKPVCRYNRSFHMPKEVFWILVSHESELIHHSQVGIEMTNANLRYLPRHEEEAESEAQIDRSDTNQSVFEKMKKRRKFEQESVMEVSFFVPYRENVHAYDLRIMSDRWVGANYYGQIDLSDVVMNVGRLEYTDLLDLRPLKISVLGNADFEDMYKQKGIQFFNPIQTQVFHTMYHSDQNVLIGSPTGSGKTIVAELAVLRNFLKRPEKKVVYVAPFKALVKERVKDWKKKFKQMNKRVEELTGDYTPDLKTLVEADVLITTPEKWDGVSRSWHSRSYVSSVGLIVFDEIHLLGQDRGPVIEVIVSRMNFIAGKLMTGMRMVGLTTAIANSADVAGWFGVPGERMFNFRPSVRPVPVEIHFKGFAEKNYCPRMNSMNKPAYNDIKKLAGNLPVLIFVSSRRQTRLTANDLISFGANDFQIKSPFLRMSEDEVGPVIRNVRDESLRQSLQFGIGMHHAGLSTSDRRIVEELFEMSKIQILVATTTLAWGVNFPAKLVIVKGTEFFDPKVKAYVDMPISDILQMIGRAGRPQYNDKGYACVYVEKTKKNFYRKYLNDPFPIESEFLSQILEHLNAEVASGTVANKQQCVDYLTWTYFFRRLVRNPLYYGLNDNNPETVQKYLNDLVDSNVETLVSLDCLSTDEDQFQLIPTFLGRLAAKYYIQPETSHYLFNSIKKNRLPVPGESPAGRLEAQDMIQILSYCAEFSEVPVRHHEPEMNLHLSDMARYPTDLSDPESPHFKTHLLFQAYLSDLPLPIRDYHTDTKTVLDNANRLIAAMVDICAELGRFRECINLLSLVQMLVQGVWADESPLVNIPGFDTREILISLKKEGITTFKDLTALFARKELKPRLQRIPGLGAREQKSVLKAVASVPSVSMSIKVFNFDSNMNKPVYREGESIRQGKEAVLVCNLENSCPGSHKGNVQVKKLKKPKRCVWWLVLGNLHSNELYAIKKMEIGRKTSRKVIFEVPNFKSKESSVLDVRLICDSYVGLNLGTSINLETYTTPK